MIILTYSKTSPATKDADLGKPEYGYYLIWKHYLPALEKIGEVVTVTDPETEVDSLYQKYRSKKQQCVFLSFTPPDEIPVGLKCPSVCVLDWKLSTIPDEALNDNANSNWVTSLKRIGQVLTVSSYAEETIRRSATVRYPVATIPAPVECQPASTQNDSAPVEKGAFELSVSGKVVDSEEFEITYDRITPIRVDDGEKSAASTWNSEPIRHFFSMENLEATQLLVGFYSAEDWGAWSRTTSPWIILPTPVDGRIEVNIEMLAHGDNIDREIEVTLGEQSQKIQVGSQLQTYTLHYSLDSPAESLQFSGLTITQTTGARDHRTLGLGLKFFSLSRPGEANKTSSPNLQNTLSEPPPLNHVSGSGIVYTAELNPADDHSNWEDVLTSFCWAFKNTPDATLILRMTHIDSSTFLGVLLQRFSELSPFKCRVIAIQGNLDEEQHQKLISATNFVVNASYCEGQCLSLMEYMSKGIPAIAPDHTGLKDYISDDNAFVVSSNTKPTSWPQDQNNCYRALIYDVNWGSILRAYQQSYRIAKEDAESYVRMGQSAQKIMRDEYSVEVLTPKLEAFLKRACKRRLFPFW